MLGAVGAGAGAAAAVRVGRPRRFSSLGADDAGALHAQALLHPLHRALGGRAERAVHGDPLAAPAQLALQVEHRVAARADAQPDGHRAGGHGRRGRGRRRRGGGGSLRRGGGGPLRDLGGRGRELDALCGGRGGTRDQEDEEDENPWCPTGDPAVSVDGTRTVLDLGLLPAAHGNAAVDRRQGHLPAFLGVIGGERRHSRGGLGRWQPPYPAHKTLHTSAPSLFACGSFAFRERTPGRGR